MPKIIDVSRFDPDSRLTAAGIAHEDILYMNDWFPVDAQDAYARDRVYTDHLRNLGRGHRLAGKKFINADIEYNSNSVVDPTTGSTRQIETDVWYFRGGEDRVTGPFVSDGAVDPWDISQPDRSTTIATWKNLWSAYNDFSIDPDTNTAVQGYGNYGKFGYYGGFPNYFNIEYETIRDGTDPLPLEGTAEYTALIAGTATTDAEKWLQYYHKWADDLANIAEPELSLINDVDYIMPTVYGNWHKYHFLYSSIPTSPSYTQFKEAWAASYLRMDTAIKARWPGKRVIWIMNIENTGGPHADDSFNWRLNELSKYADEIAVWGSDSSSFTQKEFSDNQIELMIGYHTGTINSSSISISDTSQAAGSNVVLDDWTVSNDVRRASITAKNTQYTDLDLTLNKNPYTNDISFLRDDRAIKNAVKNLLLTNFFERPFQPLKGANLKGLLFEPADAITKVKLREGISRVLTKYEPRIEVTYIDIIDLSDRNEYNITIAFLIKEIKKESQVEIQLKRLR